ncbi:EF-hand calcium-binding domain-containing protein 11 isoform X2 [Cervus elaphus]|uniref:EF-hand calcium-binding domain-containing protein 11 isoform X2 n=1 Tax=Cervus elaphus TaxID=9860 RepID=UPI001CC323D8|nr:EF-hand calcium-binding domain-containing protein 11 isoform X2 [Cervus elaphus]
MFYSQAGARPRTWEASPPEHKKWVEVFKACDEDNKGYLSREDFKVAVVMLFGYKPSKIEADSVMSSVDPNTSGIQLKEFLDIVRKKKEAHLYCNEVRHIFTAFDRHYRGYLTLEDFKKAFKQVAPKLSERIILEVFREVDQDSDGHVSFKDFEYAMNSGQNSLGFKLKLPSSFSLSFLKTLASLLDSTEKGSWADSTGTDGGTGPAFTGSWEDKDPSSGVSCLFLHATYGFRGQARSQT